MTPNIRNNIHNGYSAVSPIAYFAYTTIAISSLLVYQVTQEDQNMVSSTRINIEHTLAGHTYPHTISFSNLIEQELKKIVDTMLSQQVPAEPELDIIIANHLWQLYDYGFSE
jgi:hypothetical protein